MSRGLGVVQYCTPEGGSGFIANPALPWLSSFEMSQMSPVYDQGPGWLRDTRPGTFTNYPRFGAPYSMDGGTLPPFARDSRGMPVPVSTGCGMGAVNPDVYEARYGRAEPDESTCLQIQCGAIPQSEAGMQLIADCANAGWAGARSCSDPACGPWVNQIPACQGAQNLVLLRSDVVAPMPSITSVARSGCKQQIDTCPSALASWVQSNPWLALGLAVIASAALFGGKK